MKFKNGDWIVLKSQQVELLKVFMNKKEIEEYRRPLQIQHIEKDTNSESSFRITDKDQFIHVVKKESYRFATEEEIEKEKITSIFNR